MYNVEKHFDQMVNQYSVSLYRLLYGYCGNQQDAEDGVQTAFYKLWKNKTMFLSENHAKNWLYKVAVNYVRDLKKQKWNSVEPLDEEIPFVAEESVDLLEQIQNLREEYRIVILLYYYEEYSIKEISKMIGIKESTVATRLSRAREQLRVKLEEDYGK